MRYYLHYTGVQIRKNMKHKKGIWSLDRMALDQTTRSKVFINFGTRSKVLKMVLSFWSSAKISTYNFEH
jgi:hypothetical protein